MVPMMRERDPQAPLWNYWVNLDKRVCSDHPLRRINAMLNLSFVVKPSPTPTVGGATNRCPGRDHAHDAVVVLGRYQKRTRTDADHPRTARLPVVSGLWT